PAAGVGQLGAPRRRPVEHLHLEVMRVPWIFSHGDSPTSRTDTPLWLKPNRSVARFPVLQRRFDLDRDAAYFDLAVVQHADSDCTIGDPAHVHIPEAAAEY